MNASISTNVYCQRFVTTTMIFFDENKKTTKTISKDSLGRL